MTDATDTIATESGIATLANRQPIDGFDPEDGPWRVHGVSISEDAVTMGKSETRRFWPKQTLQQAAERGLLEGRPIVKNFHDREGQAPADDVIGEITAVGYADGLGFVYEGEISDETIAEKVDAGYLDVSPVPLIAEESFDEERQAQRVERIERFRDLAVVAEGAVPGNDISMGANPAVTALSEALSAHFDTGGDAEEDSTGAETMPAESGVDAAGGDDGPDGTKASNGEGQSTPDSDTTETMSDDTELTDKERELLAAARQRDDPTVVEASDVERLSENEELIDEYEALESPQLVEEDKHEALQERVEKVRELMADALQERTGLSDTAVEAMPFEAMAAEFETDEGDLDFEALTQSPEASGGPAPEEDDDVDLEALQTDIAVDDPDEAVEVLQQRHELFASRGWESNAQEVAEDLEALGVEV